MSKLLALETATPACSVALWLNGEITQQFEIAPQRHSDILLDRVDKLLSDAGMNLKNLDAIAFGSGPGSFMGIRIATGVAQGIAYGIDLPVIPVSTLQALAQVAYQKIKSERVIAGWDARMDSIYWGVYQVDYRNIMQAITGDHLNYPKDIEFLTKNEIGVGNAWALYRASLSPDFPFIEKEIYPEAASVAMIAHQKFKQGDVLAPQKAEPTYIRETVTRSLKKKFEFNSVYKKP
ncbi:tRNA (adenosine(37)-N6)-threonylcarbamoyltransferase complex dimerization subunit type 1 TsaB [Coxiella endosymbiont of Rhipicephalus microplus]|uniref:tRNA (adenosine(37)-N6)-threonylcarbamoyltransferase complex dimerization subunit type 1 TsaB n=1 Tax=Coxiella endosymbiont of Rhipicephalus microplus TaxID=1656186 RepID=UPI000C80C890|nr:tRNA (adenosine(37)-N6)-threonylcarbamoyltransferase complex dimerization subunit type 1 TsaB [Coxiella endosymbiont of Rhipicephalus microplus]PMB55016.1 TsaB protein, required for threonylcarbamoyladenosine (t(6)A) formation in tRNA [Coxiella-like endosymbiont]